MLSRKVKEKMSDVSCSKILRTATDFETDDLPQSKADRQHVLLRTYETCERHGDEVRQLTMPALLM